MSLRTRVIIGILITANVLLVGYISVVRSRPPVGSEVKTTKIIRLPQVQLIDDRGQALLSSQFIGQPLFVQFVNSEVRQQTDVAAAVLKDRPQQPVRFLLVTPNAQNLRARVPSITDDVTVVEKDFKELRRAFEIPECCDKTLIFDKSGTRVDQRFYYQGGALGKLHAVVDGKPSYSPVVLREAITSLKTGQIEVIRQRSLTSQSGKAVIALFSLVGTFCPSGEMLDAVKRNHANLQTVEFLILFPKNFTATDVQNVKSNLGVQVPIALADPELSILWDSFNFRHGEAQINGSLIVFDRGVVSVLQGVDELDSFLANTRSTNAKQ